MNKNLVKFGCSIIRATRQNLIELFFNVFFSSNKRTYIYIFFQCEIKKNLI